jgi:two-component system, OmpR family, osmolarity sensor histidine kinase EnvZ
MTFRWIKNAMPRGIYARAGLILLLPVLFLQLLVSVVFIQRHFDGVTRLMTSSAAIDVQFLIDQGRAARDPIAAMVAINNVAEPLQIGVQLPATDLPARDISPWTDLTGGMVIDTLRAQIDGLRAVSLQDRGRVVIWVDSAYGLLRLDFARWRVSATNPHQLLVIMVVMGGLMTAIAYIFLRNQLRPIKRMAQAAADYGKGRITPFTPTGAVEVRAAGMAFLDMRNRLERQTQSRTMMLSGVSHDLRTPLTRLRLGLSMLDSTDAADLMRDVDDMQKLLDAFLDFARSDAADQVERIAPAAIVSALLADAQRMGQNVTLVSAEGGDMPIPLRPLAIRRALDNLVGNALRYGSRALIGVQVSERAVRFWVEDDGPGIPPEQYDDAISPFVRLDPARNQDKGSGVGLGLAIVADVARSHGGVLRLGESRSLGGLKAELVISR